MTARKTTTATRKPAAKADQGGARSADSKPAVQCRCGCGATVSKRYRMGHDARHVTQLAKAVLAGEINRRAATAKLDSDALKAKLVRQLETAALAGAKSKSTSAASGKSTSAGSGESK